MPTAWYFRVKGQTQVHGPLEPTGLRSLAAEGRLRSDDLVAQSPEGPWYRADQVRGLFAAPGAGTQRAQPPASEASTSPPAPKAQPIATPPPVPPPSAPHETPHRPGRNVAEEIRLRKQMRRKRQLQFIYGSLAAIVLGLAVLVFVLVRPPTKAATANGDSAAARSPETSEPAVPDLPSDEGGVSVPGLDEILNGGGTSAEQRGAGEKETTRSAQAADPADLARDALAAFGQEYSKLTDRRGPIRVSVDKVEIGQPRLQTPTGFARPVNPYLIVRLQVANDGATDSAQYRSWAWMQPLAQVAAEGETGGHKIKRFRGGDIVGQQTEAEIAPGESIEEVLVFELPKEVDTALTLTLPGAAVHQSGAFRLVVPASRIVRSELFGAEAPAVTEGDETDGPATDSKEAEDEDDVPDVTVEMPDAPLAIPGLEDDPANRDRGPGFKDDVELKERMEAIQQEEDRRRGRTPEAR